MNNQRGIGDDAELLQGRVGPIRNTLTWIRQQQGISGVRITNGLHVGNHILLTHQNVTCLLYTSDAADE